MLTDIHSHHPDSDSEKKLISCSMPGIGNDDWDDGLYVSLSLHPWYITESNIDAQLEWIERNIHNPHVLAIGEVGVDKLCQTPLDLQLKAFRSVIELSELYRLPLIIHCVKAYNDIVNFKKERKPEQPWIIHGFRGKKEVMQMLVRHGLDLSFGERYQEESLQLIPIERLFVETDESHIKIEQLYRQMALARGMAPETFTARVQNNIQRVFF